MIRDNLARTPGVIWRSLREIEHSKLLAVLVTAVVLAIALPSGPYMEQVFAAVANPKRESIYATTFGEFLVNKDEIFQYWPGFLEFLLISSLSVVLSLNAKTRKSFFVSVWVWLAISITLMDIAFANIYKIEINIAFSALSNTIGGGVLSGICAFVFVFCEDLEIESQKFKLFSSAAISSIAGISLISCVYLLHGALFYTPSNYFQVEVVKPRGFFSSSKGVDLDRGSFHGFAPDPKTIKSFEAFNKGPVAAKITSDDPNPPVDLDIYIFRDCDLGWLGERAVGAPVISFRQVRSVAIELDSLSDVRLRFSQPASARVYESNGLISWAPSPKEAFLAYPYRALDRSEIEFLPNGNYVAQFSTSVVHLDENEVLGTKKRNITIKVDDKSVSLNLIPKGKLNSNQKKSCSIVEPGDIIANLDVSILIKVQTKENPLYFGDNGRNIDIDFGFGDFWFFAHKQKDSRNGFEGEASDLQIWGGLRKITFGGKNIEIKNDNELLSLTGPSKVFSTEEGVYIIEGVADYAYLGSVRLNQTRWESIGDEWRVWLIGGVFAALLAILRFTWSYMSPRLRGDFGSASRA
jgi:hypothetical protein